MPTAPRKLFKIGEVMGHTGLSRQTIHNYTILGLIREEKRTDSGHRLYGEEVFDRLRKVERWKLHHTLREVKQMLEAEESSRGRKTRERERV
ncbi:MAG: MerR family transcriptional regulator [Planctomycetales bacterium]|nr:MerR family transcriptional regulator [Planctomycetales bacterium]